MNGRHRSAASVLALAYAALVVYASLYPFDGWRWPVAASAADLATLPWGPSGDGFDLWSNLLGYVPFGLLLAIGQLRSGSAPRAALAVAVLVPALLSYGLEVMQAMLPTRHPSLKDFALNGSGAAIGAAFALLAHRAGFVDGWHALRQRWFEGDSEVGLVLLALWPVGLLFPAPAPLGLGQVGGTQALQAVSGWLAALTDQDTAREVAGAASAAAAAATAPAVPAATAAGLSPLGGVLITALGLLAPCVVAFAIVAPGWRRLAMAFGALVLAVAGMTLSTLLNFGPRHALAWITPWAGPAVALATVVVLLLAPMARGVVLGIGLMVLTGLIVGVAQAPGDPYFAHNLQSWEQGRFVRFHGLAQWIGWLWPYAAIAWMLSRLRHRG
jgi:VanZ family protein